MYLNKYIKAAANLKICVIGAGYVGLVTAGCFAEAGHFVICIDKDEERVDRLSHGILPFYEPGLEKLIRKNTLAGRLTFDTDLEKGVDFARLVFIAVGTPEGNGGVVDLGAISEVAQSIGELMKDYKIIVTKSTVPVGTGDYIQKIIKGRQKRTIPFSIASNPEFLREGSAVHDNFNMERAVIGTEDNHAIRVLEELYQPFTKNILITDVRTAEMIKYASNAFLATKLTYINQIANICEKVGVDVTQVSKGMGFDARIGKSYLNAGVGYGGSCLPKDTKALVAISDEVGYSFDLLKEVIHANEKQQLRIVDKLIELIGPLVDKQITVMGVTFKPNTSDIRYAPAHIVIRELKKKGALVKAYDPMADKITKNSFGATEVSSDLYESVKNSDGIIILTEWDKIKQMDLKHIKMNMKLPVIIDGRNMFSPREMKRQGFEYSSIGRPNK